MKHTGICILLAAAFSWSGCFQSDPSDVLKRDGDVVYFSGYAWDVKIFENSQMGPGPNYFSGRYEDVWVDELGYLHLRISEYNGRWYASEVVGQEAMGYGRYTWVVQADLEDIPENIVLGLFTWDNETFYTEGNSEVDIEFAKWGDASTPYTLHYSVQPTNFGPFYPERTHEAETQPGDLIGVTTHTFLWTDSIIEWSSYRGKDMVDQNLISTWSFDLNNPPRVKNENGQSSEPIVIPAPGENTNARMNFWIMTWLDAAPSDRQEHEVVIQSFSYTPYE